MISFLTSHKKVAGSLFLLALATILWMSLTQNAPAMTVDTDTHPIRIDYLLHALGYCTLGVLFLFWQPTIARQRNLWLLTLFTGFAFSAITEMAQYFVPTRSVNPFDLLANLVGLFFGLLFCRLLINRRKKRVPVVINTK